MTNSKAPRQITLDLTRTPEVTLESFIPTGNEGLYATLLAFQSSWTQGVNTSSPAMDTKLVHFWGSEGCGKSHLIQAMGHAAHGSKIGVFSLLPSSHDNIWHEAIEALEKTSRKPILIAIDDVDSLQDPGQAHLFRIHNLIRENQSDVLLTTSSLPPAQLALRDDLRTRLAWGLVFQMHSLSDSEKLQAFEHAALARGLQLSADVGPWLLRHFHRDMPSLMSLLEALDEYSLEKKRAITLPLLKEMLGQQN